LHGPPNRFCAIAMRGVTKGHGWEFRESAKAPETREMHEGAVWNKLFCGALHPATQKTCVSGAPLPAHPKTRNFLLPKGFKGL
jgi:hypothetical protein